MNTSYRRPLRFASVPWQRMHGMTMIESMVAIVVLCFGMLGVVGLQAAAWQSNREARYQASAVRLARDLGELMRSNKDIANEASSTDNPYLVEFRGTLPTANPDCLGAACATTKEVAQFQIRDWLARVEAELPGAHVTVCKDDAPYDAGGQPRWECGSAGGTIVVKIGWTPLTTDRGAVDSRGEGSAGMSRAVRPGIVLAVLAGSPQ